MIKPTADRIIVKLPEQGEKTLESGIVIPTTVTEKDKPTLGEVLAVGPKVEDIAVGDTVFFSKFSGINLEVDEDEEILILLEKDILAKR